ncbi:MAG: leucine-rich repeat domain-containing protein [Clostridia bacterium]|nr:leucine-rich repeat domain-containing protein [Clostridia bacterium]
MQKLSKKHIIMIIVIIATIIFITVITSVISDSLKRKNAPGEYVKEKELTHFEIPKGITEIANEEFYGCHTLKSVTIPDTVTRIGNRAFCGTSLESVTIPNSVKIIGHEAFAHTNLESIVIPSSVSELDGSNNVFDDIAKGAFLYCEKLKSVTLNEGLEYIGAGTFRGCKNLTSITIPSSVRMIEDQAFFYCEKLRTVNFKPNSKLEQLCSEAFQGTSISQISLPERLRSIGESCFYGCKNLVKVEYGNNLWTIGNYAFSYCTSLSEFTIKSCVTEFGYSTFLSCENLEKVTVQNPNGWIFVEVNKYGERKEIKLNLDNIEANARNFKKAKTSSTSKSATYEYNPE